MTAICFYINYRKHQIHEKGLMNHKEQQNTVLEMEYSLVLLFISSIRTTDTFERSDG